MLPTPQAISDISFLKNLSPSYPFNRTGCFNSQEYNFNVSYNFSSYSLYTTLPSYVKPQESPSFNYFNSPDVSPQMFTFSPIKIDEKGRQMASNMNFYQIEESKKENKVNVPNQTLKSPNKSKTDPYINKIIFQKAICEEKILIPPPSIRICLADKSILSNEDNDIFKKAGEVIPPIYNFQDEHTIKKGLNNFERDINQVLNKNLKPISKTCDKDSLRKKSKQVDECGPEEVLKVNNPYVTKPKKAKIIHVPLLNLNKKEKMYHLKESKSYKDNLCSKDGLNNINSDKSENSHSFYESIPSKMENSSLGDSKSIDQTPNDFARAVKNTERKFENCRANKMEECNFEFELGTQIMKATKEKKLSELTLNKLLEEEKKGYTFFGEI